MRWLLLACFACLHASSAPAVSLRDFELTDQDAKARICRFPKAKITVLAVADHKGSDQLGPWIQRLYDRYETRIDIDGIADVSMIAKPFHGVFRAAFRQQLTYSVMLDWTGSVVKQLRYTKGVANLYVVDRRGGVVRQFVGPVSEQGVQELCREIDRTLAAR